MNATISEDAISGEKGQLEPVKESVVVDVAIVKSSKMRVLKDQVLIPTLVAVESAPMTISDGPTMTSKSLVRVIYSLW